MLCSFFLAWLGHEGLGLWWCLENVHTHCLYGGLSEAFVSGLLEVAVLLHRVNVTGSVIITLKHSVCYRSFVSLARWREWRTLGCRPFLARSVPGF